MEENKEIIETEKNEAANESSPATEVPAIKNLDPNAKWYVLHTYSNYEAVAKDNLEKVIKKEKLENRIFEIFIPTEDTVVEKRDKKVLVPTKTMPSYLFVKMIYGDDIWHTVTRTNGITGFVGPKGRPLALSAKEVEDLKLERKVNNITTRLAAGDTVHVVDGLLAGQTAVVNAVDQATGKCTITVTMFGQPKSVDIEVFKVKKI